MNGQLLAKIDRREGKRKSVKKLFFLKRGNNINWHPTRKLACAHLNFFPPWEHELTRICRPGHELTAATMTAPPRKTCVTYCHRENRPNMGCKGAIAAARITLNSHTGTTERLSWHALGEHTTALTTAPGALTFTAQLPEHLEAKNEHLIPALEFLFHLNESTVCGPSGLSCPES